ncbi:keratin-associated protein 6-3-like [Anolis carolinensis]|uniref:keratin-associated protein 6-3-like n=1 Tax=Anolis carolinensis TaxID=28377 RepID=UPI002F2B377E
MTFGWGNCGFGCNVACESQGPPSEVCVQPPTYCVTMPGAILHCDTTPCAVYTTTPCGYGGCGYGGWGGFGYGGWGGCGYGSYGGCGYGGRCGYGGWGGRCGWRC